MARLDDNDDGVGGDGGDVQQLLETLKHLMRLNNRHPRKFKMKIMLFIKMEVISVEY